MTDTNTEIIKLIHRIAALPCKEERDKLILRVAEYYAGQDAIAYLRGYLGK